MYIYLGIMKGFVFWVLLSVAGTTLMMFFSLSNEGSTSSGPDTDLTGRGDDMAVVTRSRKLKEVGHTSGTSKSHAGSANLEDYNPIDPAPSSKTSIRPGPIEHGTPLMPFIPKPSPPDHPNYAGFP